MKIRLLAFGIAKDILESRSVEYELRYGSTITDLKTALTREYPDFAKLSSLSFAVNESYVSDDLVLKDNDEVVIIPPVSGG